MSITEIFTTQIIDPFRVGMLVILYLTMLRTQAASGTWAPLAAGVVFVSVLIPMTLQQLGFGPEFYRAVGVGVLTNSLILGVIWLAHRLLPRKG